MTQSAQAQPPSAARAEPQPRGGLVRAAARSAVRPFGRLRVQEARNKVALGHTAWQAKRFEDAEVARIAAGIGPRRALVATVMPTYNRPEQLVLAVESALAQTVTDQTVIVVDDGAGLPRLPEDPRLAAVSLSRNTTIAGLVRNVGIRLTDSEFVAYLDDDNTWTPNHLEMALERLRTPGGPGAVYTALTRVRADGSPSDTLSVPFDRSRLAREGFMDVNSIVMRRYPGLHFSRIIRPTRLHPREDWEMAFRTSRRLRYEHLPVATVRYLINPSSYYTEWRPEDLSGPPQAPPA